MTRSAAIHNEAIKRKAEVELKTFIEEQERKKWSWALDPETLNSICNAMLQRIAEMVLESSRKISPKEI